jgi:hypothetical protein
MFLAVRRDDGSAVTALTADSLRTEIRADYPARPGPAAFTPTPCPTRGNDQGNLRSGKIS